MNGLVKTTSTTGKHHWGLAMRLSTGLFFVLTLLTVMSLRSRPALAAPASSGWGSVMISGSSWAGSYASKGDLNVYSNGSWMGTLNSSCSTTDGRGCKYGPEYQCTELAQRWAALVWGEPSTWTGYAADMWSRGPSLPIPLIQHKNGGQDQPRFGDLLVFDRTSFDISGHVAVVRDVRTVNGSQVVDIVEQNWNFSGGGSLPINGTSMPARLAYLGKYLPILGWLRPASPPPAPQSPFNPRYVTNLYHDILGRLGSSSEVNTWAQALNQGASRSQVANGFLSSSEYRTNLVAADYQHILHRAADPSGSAYFVGQLNNGAKNEDVLVSLAASSEYFTNRGGGTNNGFVSALYQDLLQRAADPSGLAYWTQQLNNGVSRATVAQGLVTSTEYRTKLVDGYYLHYLGRPADSSGESYFVGLLNNGGTDESVIAGLVTSDEYFAKPSWLSVRYVTNLYHDILGRAGSSSDVNTWAQAIDNGSSRAQVANGFLSSPEYRTNLVATDYQQMLHRVADASGSAYFVGQLNNGAKNENVLVSLAASDEYFTNRGGGTNSGFVSALYQDLLQRAADPSGLAYWTQQLNNGVSRATVAQGLIMSTEYRTKLVDGYYLHYLGRPADSSGESYFVGLLNNGGTDENVIAGLVTSDEYYAK